VDASERALEHVRLAGDRFEEREIVEWLLVALLLGPAPAAEAAARCERLLADSADHSLLQAEILGALASLVAIQGRTGEADEHIARSRAIMNDVGERIWLVSLWWSFVCLWRGDALAAEHELRPGYDALKKLGETSNFSGFSHALANADYMQGRYDEAEQLTRESEHSSRPNDVYSHVHWRSTRAKLLARRGELDAAQRLAREALEFASQSDFHLAHADALLDLGEVLDLAGDAEAAAAAVEHAILGSGSPSSTTQHRDECSRTYRCALSQARRLDRAQPRSHDRPVPDRVGRYPRHRLTVTPGPASRTSTTSGTSSKSVIGRRSEHWWVRPTRHLSSLVACRSRLERR
jgi:tetratricopeptide (TPR) repeat protein